MREFEVTTPKEFLGKRVLSEGNTEKFVVRLNGFFACGVILTAATAAVTSPTATVSAPAMSRDHRATTFLVTSPTAGDDFVLTLTIATSDGQTLNYTIEFEVAAPRIAS